MKKNVTITTKDGVKLFANYFSVNDKKAPAVVLLHMMPSDKDSWYDFQKKLATAGFQSLAIDFRGHGESVFKNGEKIDYQNFTDTQQQDKIYDVEASVKFFKDKGIPNEKISLVGASIGANLALQYQSENSNIKTSILMSPGLDYRGVTSKDKIENLTDGQSVLFCSGGDKDDYSRETARKLFEEASVKKEIKIFEDAEHGTNLFKTHPEFQDYMISWLQAV